MEEATASSRRNGSICVDVSPRDARMGRFAYRKGNAGQMGLALKPRDATGTYPNPIVQDVRLQ